VASPCRCAEVSELFGQEAVDYLDHLAYVTEGDDGWLFTCAETDTGWVAPYLPKDAPEADFVLRQRP
jgi:hypothetical protein